MRLASWLFFDQRPQALESKPKGACMVQKQMVKVSIDALLNQTSGQACDLANFSAMQSEPALRKLKGVANYG